MILKNHVIQQVNIPPVFIDYFIMFKLFALIPLD